MEHVVLVNEQDEEIGTMEKMEAHQKGVLHRAFSVLLFNSAGDLLIHKRAKGKYHSAGLWTNTCCSHPLPGENIQTAVERRLKEELGIHNQPEFVYKFIYRTVLGNLIEHEYDHVFVGKFDGIPTPDEKEIETWRFIDLKTLHQDLIKYPENFTSWFKLIMSHGQVQKSLILIG